MKSFKQLREKTLTPAEKKKREEIAKAIEKDEPDMPMDKKMAIATAQAKKVAEGALDEGKLPPHLAKFFDKKGELKPEVLDRLKKSKKGHEFLMGKDVAPKGYGVKEEVELDEGVISDVKDVVAKKQAKKIQGVMVDLFTASAISQIYDKVNDANKAKMDNMKITQLANAAMKIMKRESVNEAKDDAEYNDEGGMAISQLKTAKSAVEELMSIIKDNDNLPEWVQSKLTKAVDYMDSVRDYMSSEKSNVQEARKDASADLYFDTYSAAVQHARAQAEKKGFEVVEDDWFRQVNTGKGKPSGGKTTRHTLKLTKNGKPVRQSLSIQVYNRETAKKPFELNFYVS